MTVATLEIQLLGDFQIRIGERVITDDAWKLRKAAGIVKLLALEPGHRQHREQLLDILWPELDPDAAANNFRYALHTARRILDAGGIPLREGEFLSLGNNESVWVDALAFEVAADFARRTNDPVARRAAADLYRGWTRGELRYTRASLRSLPDLRSRRKKPGTPPRQSTPGSVSSLSIQSRKKHTRTSCCCTPAQDDSGRRWPSLSG